MHYFAYDIDCMDGASRVLAHCDTHAKFEDAMDELDDTYVAINNMLHTGFSPEYQDTLNTIYHVDLDLDDDEKMDCTDEVYYGMVQTNLAKGYLLLKYYDKDEIERHLVPIGCFSNLKDTQTYAKQLLKDHIHAVCGNIKIGRSMVVQDKFKICTQFGEPCAVAMYIVKF